MVTQKLSTDDIQHEDRQSMYVILRVVKTLRAHLGGVENVHRFIDY